MRVKFEIMVVGAGGTGGNYLKELGRLIYSLQDVERRNVYLSIIDGDRVEERNIARQPFVTDDIGEYKSVVMAEALRDVFGLDQVRSFAKYIMSVDDIENAWYSGDYYCSYGQEIKILVGCVDNHHARKVMHNYFNKCMDNIIYLDAANEFESGEVVIAAKINGKVIGKDRQHYYPDIFKGKLKTAEELSCLELNEVAPQHLVTNMMASNILLSKTAMAMKGALQCGIVYFNAFTSQSKFIPYKEDQRNVERKGKGCCRKSCKVL